MDNKLLQTLGSLLNFGFVDDAHVRSSNNATCRGKLEGDRVTLTFTTIFNFDRKSYNYSSVVRELCLEADICLKQYLEKIEKECKENCGKKVKFEEVSKHDTIEPITSNQQSPIITNLFRYNKVYQIK